MKLYQYVHFSDQKSFLSDEESVLNNLGRAIVAPNPDDFIDDLT